MLRQMKKVAFWCVLLTLCLMPAVHARTLFDPWNIVTVDVTIYMETGDEIHLELYPNDAPNTVANFIDLAQSGYYNGMTFSRIITGSLIQCGDPMEKGEEQDFAISGEFPANGNFPNALSHARGALSMARNASGAGGDDRGYDTAGTQFFILLQDDPSLDGQYAMFGMVKDNDSLAVADKIAATQTDASDRPLTDWRIRTISVDLQNTTYTPVAPVRMAVESLTPADHEHVWVDRSATVQVWVQEREAYQEEVLDRAAWDETVIDTPAWSEQVLISEGWTEYIPEKTITTYTASGEAITTTEPARTIEHPADYQTIEHPAQTHVEHHGASYKTVTHPAEGHWNEQSKVVGQVCAICHASRRN